MYCYLNKVKFGVLVTIKGRRRHLLITVKKIDKDKKIVEKYE